MSGCQADSDTSRSDKDVEFDGDCTTTTLLSDHDDLHNSSTLPLQATLLGDQRGLHNSSTLPLQAPPTVAVTEVAPHTTPTQTVLTSQGSSHKVFNVTNYGNVDEAPMTATKSVNRAMLTLGYDTSDDTTCYTEEGEEEDDEEEEEDEADERNNNIHLGPTLSRFVETRRQASPPPRNSVNFLREHYRRAMAKQGILAPLAERGRLYAGRKVHRFIAKTGELNMTFKNVGRRWRYLADIFTTLMDTRWRYDILLFVVAFVFSWLMFAVMWYVISWCHGDVDHVDDDAWTPCVDGVDDFTTALLFSIETQHTIGYGTRAVTRRCPAAIFLVMVQSVTGVFIQCLVTGIIFAKLSRGKNRAQTILFSKTAVLCTRRGHPCLMFRVGDMRRSQIIDATIHVLLLKRKLMDYGEELPTFQHYLKVHTECEDSFFFLAWPTKVIHRITADSPLWTVTAESLLLQEMEIVVILEGVVEGTGMSTQVRTSYLPCEIMWGHRLAPLMTYHSDNGQHTIDYRQFHSTIPVDMPECSPKEMVLRRKKTTQSEKQNTDKQQRKRKSGRFDVDS